MISAQSLAHLNLFEGLTPAQQEIVTSLGSELRVPQGATLFHVGDEAQQLYVLLEGKIVIQVQLTSRPERIDTVILTQPGEIVGWSGLIGPHVYTAAALCKADSWLLAFDGPTLLEALERDHTLGFRLMARIADTISARLRLIQQVMLKTL